MDITRDYINVKMIRENLDDVPEFSVPSGYSMRWYRCGDADIWLRIQSLADEYNKVTSGLHKAEFGADDRVLAQRQCFLCDADGNAIGTASAWFDSQDGRLLGRIHWVAIIPAHQGRGLAAPLLSCACNRLRSLGHARTYLTTQTCRVRAINLYAKFGFAPVIESGRDRDIWRELKRHIEYPLRF